VTVDLTAVVVTYSPGPYLDVLLDSLERACSVRYDVVLADNGSQDGVPERSAQDRTGVRLLRMGGNLGYGAAANLGVSTTAAPWVLVLNPDLMLEPGSVDVLLDASRRWPRAGALGPAIRDPDGSPYPTGRRTPSLVVGSLHAALSGVWPDNPWSRAYLQVDSLETERTAGWLSGACLLLRRQAWESVGGFDPDYFMYFEDVDLGERLARMGWLNIYVPSSKVVHIGGTTTSRQPVEMLRAHHESAARYVTARYPRPVALAVRAGLRTRLAVLTRRGRSPEVPRE
jgi:N-acetylglucosaminyl-diphospho-decaprenol L-rhamnosyltransferase